MDKHIFSCGSLMRVLCLLALSWSSVGCIHESDRVLVGISKDAAVEIYQNPHDADFVQQAAKDIAENLDQAQEGIGSPKIRVNYSPETSSKWREQSKLDHELEDKVWGMVTGAVSQFMPFGLAGSLLGLLALVRKNKNLKDGVKVLVGAMETAADTADAKVQVQGAANPEVEAAVKEMKTQRAQSPTDAG